MANGTKTGVSNNELNRLREEVALLRSIVISILGEDREGKYRSSFVKTILKASKEQPKLQFKGADDLIKRLKHA